MFCSSLDSPIGKIFVKANESAVCYIGFAEEISEENSNELTEMAISQLSEYFASKRTEFDFPFEQPGTDFQQNVWKALLSIPAGKPISYAALSKKMHHPLAIRAIAAANGKNNLMILIPCHRVIGSNGDLVGYAGGLWRKKWLLNHEAMTTQSGQSFLIL
ncbi:methylated-DNA--[protein]-cysteine S-methyltransferase [Daejeonella oryzae]|uniref:methylated-DNA--[protein]-cysteine S-methyltransferase n=1 Tax=Daejeonella oryzae TaxID=1122943 RepID=UPI000412B473|nr:methylated-DNA--[protein]-cysteine S-methyltransferase [Daejeonella oryzae]